MSGQVIEPNVRGMSHTGPSDRVLDARKRLTAAMHAMHADPRILVDPDLARELAAAWEDYDAAVRGERGAPRKSR